MKDSIAKEKKWGKKCLEIMTIKGGGGVWRLMAKTILYFHFDYLKTSLRMANSDQLMNNQENLRKKSPLGLICWLDPFQKDPYGFMKNPHM